MAKHRNNCPAEILEWMVALAVLSLLAACVVAMVEKLLGLI